MIESVSHSPIYLWSTVASDECLAQLRAIASQPYIVGAVAAMSDAHLSSSGVAVGTVFATAHELVPDALGDDLACGVRVARLSRSASALDRARCERLLRRFREAIPTESRRARSLTERDDSMSEAVLSTRELTRRWPQLVDRHLGTLGGGNHFIELDRDADDGLWLLVHSGSRGVGGAIAEHHQRAARSSGPVAAPLRALDVRSEQGASFFSDLAAATQFAAHNRAQLARLAVECISAIVDEGVEELDAFDVVHNTIQREEHQGRALLLHRKGAARARAGDRLVIPGSMATATYIVDGLGDERSWCSCSHGAGRVLSRREAHKRIRSEALVARMGKVVFDRARARSLVEEAPQVYRDVRAVIDEQRELVAPVLRIEPVLSFKG
ncbi:MAG: RtcB family protein [Polyangiales bacterium]